MTRYRIVNIYGSHGAWRSWESLLALVRRFAQEGNLHLISRVEADR